MVLIPTNVLPSAKNLRLASARRRVRAFIDQIAELEASDFAHRDGEEALRLIKIDSIALRTFLERIPPQANDATIDQACMQTSLMVSRYTDILGFILRSTNVRNAFEVHFPLKRLIEKAVNPDARLIMSSEWKFVPFTYPMTLDLLPGFALVGGPAPESGNMLIVPLAGHEIGHSAWRSKGMYGFVIDALTKAIAQAIEDLPVERDLVLQQLAAGGSPMPRLQDAVLRSSLKQLEEIYCDLFGLFVFGPSFLFAYEYFLAPGGEVRSAFYPASGDRVRYLLDAAAVLHIVPEANLFGSWAEAAPLPAVDGAVLAIADRAVAVIYPTLRDRAFELLATDGVTTPDPEAVERVLNALRQHVPDGDGATLPEIVTAGWLHLRERGGMSLDEDTAEYQILNELMLKSVEVSEFKLRVESHA
jgi:hypothetical protein